jgi:gas vesicle protein
MTTDVRKTFVDAGYIAIGLGVMGYQQAQERGRELRTRATEMTDQVEHCIAERVREVQNFVAEGSRQVDRRSRLARQRAEDQARATVARATGLGSEVTKRVEPVVAQVQAQVSELPERVVQAMEPVAARVREFAGSAA